ncbi:SKI/DACH domain-containing protein 1 [Megalops cyprinoides]|uniref:SKI/DACH domain-containing protein 1 n=1 Tax=Megalops cyprinoides TaxID=118141 RepID=UPI001864F22A|nr:SKI/DACH domain-containing protein 1 [Megalops cyprinoides]
MGDLESGYEEMEGVKLGYLIIKGKQMFALSQVFTDLLKNIPRTTVHKRMDHLNVKKHHCDLEELRKLKAINSIAFHAAKCTLISREDVEALYISCKTERVLKSKKRKTTTSSSEVTCDGQIRSEPHGAFWKEKLWLSLHGVPQTFSFKNRTGRQEAVSPPASNLPQIYSKFACRGYQTVTKSECKSLKNYETAQIPSKRVAFNSSHSFFRNVICTRQPLLCQSAIAAQSRRSSTADLIYKRKREHEDTGRQFWSTSRHSRQVLFVPKCCKSKVSNGSLNKFHLEHELYLDHQHIGNLQESCSSDTESSSYSEQVDDSDFGSSLSTSSNSGTSDDDEDDSLSESSDASTDDDSSSQSDSSSVSSHVSLQSIRLRRTSFSALSNKAPLAPQPSFHCNLQHRATNHSGTTVLDYGISNRKLKKSDFIHTPCVNKYEDGSASKQHSTCPLLLGSYFPDPRKERVSGTLSHIEIPDDPKTTDPAIKSVIETGSSPCSKGNKEFPPQRVSGQAKKCPQALISYCAQDKETIVSQFTDNNPSFAVNLKKEAKISHCLQLPPPPNIKTEVEELSTPADGHNENNTPAKTPPTLLQNVKIKVEEISDDYEYSCQAPGLGWEYQCSLTEPYISSGQYPSGEDKPIHNVNNVNEATECAGHPANSRKSPTRNQEFQSTLSTPYPEEGEYKNGARVRKNYRTLVLGKQSGIPRTQLKLNGKVDRTPRSTGKPENYEGSPEDFTVSSKRKRASGNVAAVKKPFNFMANFPSPPSLIIGSDGDLSPAYSLNSVKDNPPHRSHPVWKWQLGGSAVPLPPSHKFRKF